MDLGTLYLVPTPIGHPGDITLRAIEVLRTVALIAAEDTRHARTLLRPLDIDTRLVSYHDHNEESRTSQLLDSLRAGSDVALISDAGTPMVNDPGYRLVTGAIEAGVRVVPLPGASAAISALIGSGMPVHRFCYVGFLPRKSAARQAALRELADLDASLIFFEAPHRLVEMLRDLRAVLGDRRAALARSISKPDEQFLRGRLAELESELAAEDTVRGQYTVVVAGADPTTGAVERTEAGRLATVLLASGADPRLTRAVVQQLTGLARNEVYELVAGLDATALAGSSPKKS
ncbi:MAG: 16S rRNA (cytidine(1402)-2'-O)-methyltransferase [Jatrophihabitantaceae bacterium]